MDIVNGKAGVLPASKGAQAAPAVLARTPLAGPPLRASASFSFPKPTQPTSNVFAPATPPVSSSFSFTPSAAAQRPTPVMFPTLSKAPTVPKAADPPAMPRFSFEAPPPAKVSLASPQPPSPAARSMFTFTASSSSQPAARPNKAPESEPASSLFPPLPQAAGAAASSPGPTATPPPTEPKPVAEQPVKIQVSTPTAAPLPSAPVPAVASKPRYSPQELALSVPHILSAICSEVFAALFDRDILLYRDVIDAEIAERQAIADAEDALARQEEEELEEEREAEAERQRRKSRLAEIRSHVLARKYGRLWREEAARRARMEVERKELDRRVHRLGLGGNSWSAPLYRPPSPIGPILEFQEPVSSPTLAPMTPKSYPAPALSDRAMTAELPNDLASALGVFDDHIAPLRPAKRVHASPKRKRDWEQVEQKEGEEEGKTESSAVKMMKLQRAMRAAARLITT